MVMMRQDDPRHAGSVATLWPVARLAVALGHRLGLWCSASPVRAALHRVGLRWRRPRLAMPRKVAPENASTPWGMAQAVVAASPEAAILYRAESRRPRLPLLRALWHGVGQPRRIPPPGTKVTRALFGALEMRTGRWVSRIRERMRTDDCLAFLEPLLLASAAGPVLRIGENVSRHTAHAVEAGLAVHPRVQLYDLPKHCSHLKPVERIWLRRKNTLAAKRFYGAMKRLRETTEAFFMEMTPEQARRWAAV